MKALNAMLLIAETFISLCDEMPLKKISISDIVERAEKNRKTFYYHFENKDHLIIWIFRYDLAQILQNRFPENVLAYEDPKSGNLAQFPYYIMQKTGVRSLDHSQFFECFSKTLNQKSQFYKQALLDNSPGSLRNYLYNLYLEAIKKDIMLILANRYLSKENIQFLAEFYTCAFLYYFIRKCCDQPRSTQESSHAGPFANIIHSSLEMEIKEVQLKRKL